MASISLEKGSLVLITGVNGYIAAHIADQTLAAGYKVRGTVRDLKKADWLEARFSKKYGEGSFEAVVVKDMADEGSFDHVMQGVSGVVHAASNLSFSPNADEVIPGVVAGAVNVLHAAAAHPDIKRLVYTSSSSACSMMTPNAEEHIDVNTWNNESVELAKADPSSQQARSSMHGYAVYCASKTLAEKKCWDFVKEKKPAFVLNTVCPNYNMGRVFDESESKSTGGMILGVWHNDEQSIESMKMIGPQHFVDVQDTARLHVAALMYEDVKNERLLGFDTPFNITSILECMQKIDPDQKLPDLPAVEGKCLSTVSNERAAELLKRFGRPGFTDFETSVRMNVGKA